MQTAKSTFLRTYKYGFIGSNNFIFGSDEATFHGIRDNVSSVYSDACPVRAFGAYRLLRLDVEVQTASISFKTYRMDYPRHAAYASNHRGILRAGTFVRLSDAIAIHGGTRGVCDKLRLLQIGKQRL